MRIRNAEKSGVSGVLGVPEFGGTDVTVPPH